MSAHPITSECGIRSRVLRTREAARSLARLPGKSRNEILIAAAAAIENRSDEILAANQVDYVTLASEIASGRVSEAFARRLRTSAVGIKEMAARVRDVAALDDPLERPHATTQLDDGLTLVKVPCPLGVIAVIFESRPDVIPQVASLAIKSGNGLVLKGGAEASCTNAVLASIWREILVSHDEALADVICLLEDRSEVPLLLTLDREIDLVVPRGSTDFVEYIFRNSRIPVLGHGSGICHIYVDRSADLQVAVNVIVDAKTQYPAACNSVEKILVHEDLSGLLPVLIGQLHAAGVEVRACERTAATCPDLPIVAAGEEDWSTEYCDLKLTVRVVRDLNEAISHINRYGSRHTECILTEDRSAAELFLNEVDAASVFHNASTRFADGFRYGFGAELGISTSKLHARGPVGMEGMLTYKYKLRGSGQVVSTYAQGQRSFQHRRI